MKKKLTPEQHWKMMALKARLEQMQQAMLLGQETERRLKIELESTQKSNAVAKQQYSAMGGALKSEFVLLGESLGATGDPDTWKIHLEDEPSASCLEWKKPAKDKEKNQPQ